MAEITKEEAQRLGLGTETIEVDDRELKAARQRVFLEDLDKTPLAEVGEVIARAGMDKHDALKKTPDPSRPALDESPEVDERIKAATEEGDARAVERILWEAGRLDEKPQRLHQAEHDALWGRGA